MTQNSNHAEPAAEVREPPSTRERIDALLDEALQETFPASDSSAIGSGIAEIKQEDLEQKLVNQRSIAYASLVTAMVAAAGSALPPPPQGATP